MAFNFNGYEPASINFNGYPISKVNLDGNVVWEAGGGTQDYAEFSFIDGTAQTMTIAPGTYRIQCLGGSGGSIMTDSGNDIVVNRAGGLGGRIQCDYEALTETTLYVFCGQSADNARPGDILNGTKTANGGASNGPGGLASVDGTTIGSPAGSNTAGGGGGGNMPAQTGAGLGGGGATFVSLIDGLMMSDLIIMAGGGGGAGQSTSSPTGGNGGYGRSAGQRGGNASGGLGGVIQSTTGVQAHAGGVFFGGGALYGAGGGGNGGGAGGSSPLYRGGGGGASAEGLASGISNIVDPGDIFTNGIQCIIEKIA